MTGFGRFGPACLTAPKLTDRHGEPCHDEGRSGTVFHAPSRQSEMLQDEVGSAAYLHLWHHLDFVAERRKRHQQPLIFVDGFLQAVPTPLFIDVNFRPGRRHEDQPIVALRPVRLQDRPSRGIFQRCSSIYEVPVKKHRAGHGHFSMENPGHFSVEINKA